MNARVKVGPEQARGLRRWNVAMAVLHAVSALAMVALANDFSLPVTDYVADHPPGAPLDPANTVTLFTYSLAWGTAAFALLSSLFHALVAGPAFDRYLDELRHGRNRFRWVEYSLSSTLMIVLIAGLNLVTDVTALIGIAGANVAMILFGWIMEVANPPERKRTWWAPFVFGSIAGAVPWIAIAASIFAGGGASQVPTFVWAIVVSLFLFFNCFALVQWLHYRGRGRLADYLVGERTYQVLSLVAKTLLAWQIFAGALAG